MDQLYVALIFFVIVGFAFFKIIRWLIADDHRRSFFEVAYCVVGFFLSLFLGDGEIGFERPGYFEKAGYTLKNQSGVLRFPMNGNSVSVTFDIAPIGLNSAGLVNLRDSHGNSMFEDYTCSKNSLGSVIFICNRSMLLLPANRGWSEDVLPFLHFGRNISKDS